MAGSTKTRAGSRNSKQVPFEEIDFAIFKENSKVNSFMTDERSIAFWVQYLNQYYSNNGKQDNATADIIWLKSSMHHKVFAQIRECTFNQDGAKHNQLTISFYCSTFRILLQGNNCQSWCSEVFPKIKAMVESARSRQEQISLQTVLDKLILSEDEQREQPDENQTRNETTTEVEQHSPSVSMLHKRNIETLPTTPRRPRLLPTPPAVQQSIETLTKIINKLEEENIELKQQLHESKIIIEQMKCDYNQQKTTVESIQKQISELRQITTENNYGSLFLEIESIKSETTKEVKNQTTNNKSLRKDMQDIHAKHRALEDDLTAIKDGISSDTKWRAKFEQKMELQTKTIQDAVEELNKIQETMFDGETITGKKTSKIATTDSGVTINENRSLIVELDTPSSRTTTNNTHVKVFKDMKGKSLVFGDSNTKGLDPSKLKMRIGSLSGATLDSAIIHLQESNQPDTIPQLVTYHLGTNDLLNNIDLDEMKSKINNISELATKKYPKASVGFCQLPEVRNVSQDKVREINTFLNQHEQVFFIKNEISEHNLNYDRLHYNNKGLALLATSIKIWAREQGYVPRPRRQNDYYETGSFHNYPTENNHWREYNYNSRNPHYYRSNHEDRSRYSSEDNYLPTRNRNQYRGKYESDYYSRGYRFDNSFRGENVYRPDNFNRSY